VRTPISGAGNSQPNGSEGFTLIEMLALLAIIAIAVGAAASSIGNGRAGRSPEIAAMETALRARGLRHHAIRYGRDTVLLVDTSARAIGGGPDIPIYNVDPSVDINLVISENERISADVGGIRFFANGKSSGGAIVFRRGGKVHEVRINWFSGRVEILASGRVAGERLRSNLHDIRRAGVQ
jgi:general secretion pathway protein H